jgi:hypothetical protein
MKMKTKHIVPLSSQTVAYDGLKRRPDAEGRQAA